MTLVDLSHELYSGMPQVPILPAVEVSCLFSIAEGKALNIAKVTLATHSGSHIDAPFHAFQDRPTIDQMPLDTFVAGDELSVYGYETSFDNAIDLLFDIEVTFY